MVIKFLMALRKMLEIVLSWCNIYVITYDVEEFSFMNCMSLLFQINRIIMLIMGICVLMYFSVITLLFFMDRYREQKFKALLCAIIYPFIWPYYFVYYFNTRQLLNFTDNFLVALYSTFKHNEESLDLEQE